MAEAHVLDARSASSLSRHVATSPGSRGKGSRVRAGPRRARCAALSCRIGAGSASDVVSSVSSSSRVTVPIAPYLIPFSRILRTPRVDGRHSILARMFSRDTQALMEAAVDAIIVIDHRGTDAGRQRFHPPHVRLSAPTSCSARTSACSCRSPTACARRLHRPVPRRRARPKVIGIGRDSHRHSTAMARSFPRASRSGVFRTRPAAFRGPDARHHAPNTRPPPRSSSSATGRTPISSCTIPSCSSSTRDRRVREINARGSELLGAPRAGHRRSRLARLHRRRSGTRTRTTPARERARRAAARASANSIAG